jgi:hypothetical protein
MAFYDEVLFDTAADSMMNELDAEEFVEMLIEDIRSSSEYKEIYNDAVVEDVDNVKEWEKKLLWGELASNYIQWMAKMMDHWNVNMDDLSWDDVYIDFADEFTKKNSGYIVRFINEIS